MLAGYHLSIRNGYYGAACAAAANGLTAYQYFPKNPRSLAVKVFDASDAARCRSFCREHRLLSIAHSAYPVNPAADDPDFRRAMAASLINDLEIAEACGSLGVVVHFGKYAGSDILQGYKNTLQLLNELLSAHRGQTLILLENQAGGGTPMGTTPEEMMQIRKLCANPDRVAFCLDTCHLFASGVWTGTNWNEVARRGERLGFFAHVRAVHLNDSLFPSGSLRDRHARIGKGCIPADGWRSCLRYLDGLQVPCILETPDNHHTCDHREEFAFIRRLLTE
ncbi:MAG TPA: deoxyribonuclease IV [Bacilli bacterium]